MRTILAILLLLAGTICLRAQNSTADTYCIKFGDRSGGKYFVAVRRDTIPTEWRKLYEEKLNGWGALLSTFHEEPLADSTREIFRSVTFGSSSNPKDVQILRIERTGDKVEVTVKFVRKLKDSTIVVHKNIVGKDAWQEFRVVADKYIISQPPTIKTRHLIYDGSTTVFEGYLANRYYYLERRVMSITDPELQDVNRFLFQIAGDIIEVNCKKNTREN